MGEVVQRHLRTSEQEEVVAGTRTAAELDILFVINAHPTVLSMATQKDQRKQQSEATNASARNRILSGIVGLGWGSFALGAHWGATSPGMDMRAAAEMAATSVVAIVFATAFMGRLLTHRGKWFYFSSFLLFGAIINGAVGGVMQGPSANGSRAMVGGAVCSSMLLAFAAGGLAALERAPRSR